jgi:hypothetical protein
MNTLDGGSDAMPAADADGGDGTFPDGFSVMDMARDMTPPPDQMVNPEEYPMYAHDDLTLYVVVPNGESFDLDTVGDFNVDDAITDLAVTPDGRLFVISNTALYEANKTTGQATLLTKVDGDNVALTFLPDNTLLASGQSGLVTRINPDTGDITDVGEFGSGFATAGDLVAVADGTMYAISDEPDAQDNNILITVNTQTGAGTEVGRIGFGNVWGVAYNGGKLYAFTEPGQLIEIDPQTGAGKLVRDFGKEDGVRFWGAGVNPLVRPRG